MVIAKRAAERVHRETVTSTTADRCEIDASVAVLIERLPLSAFHDSCSLDT